MWLCCCWPWTGSVLWSACSLVDSFSYVMISTQLSANFSFLIMASFLQASWISGSCLPFLFFIFFSIDIITASFQIWGTLPSDQLRLNNSSIFDRAVLFWRFSISLVISSGPGDFLYFRYLKAFSSSGRVIILVIESHMVVLLAASFCSLRASSDGNVTFLGIGLC